MLYSKRISTDAEADVSISIIDLLQSTSRTMIFAVGCLFVFWILTVTVFLFWRPVGLYGWFLLPLFVPIWVLALWLVSRNLLAAQIVWQAGLGVTITLAIFLLESPEFAFFYALLPLMAMISIGLTAGLIVEGIIVVLVWWLTQSPLAPAFPFGYGAATIYAGAVCLILGWSVTHAMTTVAHWAFASYAEAQENMKEACQHRAELLLLNKNLDHAHYLLDRANSSLVVAWHAADEAARFKTEFINNVSHELRTPLNLIVGFSEMMMTSPESYDNVVLPKAYRGDMNSIYHNAQHLLALVDDILDIGRIEAGRVSIIRDKLDLSSVVTEAVDMIRDYIVAKGLDLHIHLPPHLPEISGDRLRIRQVLLNLLVNASRFTEKGGIEVAVAQKEEDVVVRVTDTGPGIPPQDLPKIFEEFRSTEAPLSTWHSGTGLGLPISKKFIKLHGGCMGVESTVGEGTTFWFSLPSSEPAADPLAEKPQADSGWRLPPVQLRSTEPIVVIAHSDPHVAPAMQRYLEAYHIIGTDTVAEGLELAKEEKAIAVIAEHDDFNGSNPANKPALPGWEDTPLLVNCSLPSGKWAALILGVKEFLPKPVSRQTLFTAIEEIETSVKTVLIVDDNPEVVELFERILKGYPAVDEYLHAYNGADALSLAREKRPDLIILDLVMPVMDGQAMLEQMSGDPDLADIPVIAVSAEVQHQFDLESSGEIRIARSTGFKVDEVARALEAIFKSLAPGWHQLDATVSTTAREIPASPV